MMLLPKQGSTFIKSFLLVIFNHVSNPQDSNKDKNNNFHRTTKKKHENTHPVVRFVQLTNLLETGHSSPRKLRLQTLIESLTREFCQAPENPIAQDDMLILGFI